LMNFCGYGVQWTCRASYCASLLSFTRTILPGLKTQRSIILWNQSISKVCGCWFKPAGKVEEGVFSEGNSPKMSGFQKMCEAHKWRGRCWWNGIQMEE
jgi:hypothetical protein